MRERSSLSPDLRENCVSGSDVSLFSALHINQERARTCALGNALSWKIGADHPAFSRCAGSREGTRCGVLAIRALDPSSRENFANNRFGRSKNMCFGFQWEQEGWIDIHATLYFVLDENKTAPFFTRHFSEEKNILLKNFTSEIDFEGQDNKFSVEN